MGPAPGRGLARRRRRAGPRAPTSGDPRDPPRRVRRTARRAPAAVRRDRPGAIDPVGIGWHREGDLDDELERLGAPLRGTREIATHRAEPLGALIDGIERNRYSWTWPVPEDRRRSAAAELRDWTAARFGPLDRPITYEAPIVWRIYDRAG